MACRGMEKKEKQKKKGKTLLGKTARKWLLGPGKTARRAYIKAHMIELSKRNLWLQWILETDFSGPVDLDRAP